jgi:hypothetical protein
MIQEYRESGLRRFPGLVTGSVTARR